jgi:hypothetical protein
MSFFRILVAMAALTSLVAASAAEAAQKHQKPSRKRVIILDRSLYGPPPPPHDRRYVGPAPAIQPPMDPVPRVAPLAQPPLR